MVYEVRNSELVVVIIVVGKREANTVYKRAATR
jgi:mRNA-degrading endonuclease RelE of RelBE toxin-antitoxin system